MMQLFLNVKAHLTAWRYATPEVQYFSI